MAGEFFYVPKNDDKNIFEFFFEKALDYFLNRSIIAIVDRKVDMHH